MIVRLVVVLAVVVVALAARVALQRRLRWSAEDTLPGARFPGWVTNGATRTWGVINNPNCASWGPLDVPHQRGERPDVPRARHG